MKDGLSVGSIVLQVLALVIAILFLINFYKRGDWIWLLIVCVSGLLLILSNYY